jgi:hypothetical protein
MLIAPVERPSRVDSVSVLCATPFQLQPRHLPKRAEACRQGHLLKAHAVGVECYTGECADRPQSFLWIHRMRSPKTPPGSKYDVPAVVFQLGP